jgi:hypothetical protein
MRVVIAGRLVLLPPIAAVVFVKATSSPRDANVGGAFYLVLGVIVGVALAALYLRRSGPHGRA